MYACLSTTGSPRDGEDAREQRAGRAPPGSAPRPHHHHDHSHRPTLATGWRLPRRASSSSDSRWSKVHTNGVGGGVAKSQSRTSRTGEEEKKGGEGGPLSQRFAPAAASRGVARDTRSRFARARTSRARASAACSWLATSRESERPSASA